MKLGVNSRKKSAILAAVLGSCLFGHSAGAANLVAGIPSDYTNSQMGAITGSYVTTDVDSKPAAGVVTDLNRDPVLFNIIVNGESKIFLRQYTYSTTELKSSVIMDADGDWNAKDLPAGKITDVPNAHAAAASGNILFTSGYDLGQIGVAKIGDTSITEDVSKTVNLKNDIIRYCGGSYTDAATVHGEGLLVKDGYLYVMASVNINGGYQDYDDGYLMQYRIGNDGSLAWQGYTRMGRNTDTPRMNLYNDMILVSAIGGYQNYGDGNKETSIDVASITGGQLDTFSSRKINVPNNVSSKGLDFRDLKVLPNGTAYIMTYNLSGGSGGINSRIYKTTMANLMSDNPKDWEEIISGNPSGGGQSGSDWFGKIDAEYYTKRLWVEIGDNLSVYTDGAASPTFTWQTKDFSTDEQLYKWNSMITLQPDVVFGDTAKLTISSQEGLTAPSRVVEQIVNQNATVKKGDYSVSITGTDKDSKYSDATKDNKVYSFDKDTVINLGLMAEGDYDTNVLAGIYAHDGNDITVNAGNNSLQLQSKNYIASPVGIYAGNGKDVTVNAGELNIITAGYENGNTLTNAIWNDAGLNSGSTITINAPVNISMSGGYGGNGIAIQKTDRWGESSSEANVESKIIINGDVNIKGADNNTWGIPINSENVFSRFNNAGVLTSVNNSSVVINGNIDFDIYGNGVTTNAEGSSVTINGGKVTVPKGMKYGYYTLASYLGTINMNAGVDGKTPGKNTVQLDGDIFALKTGNINLGLTTADSYLNGIVDNGGTVNLWLQNGAVWNNIANNNRYKQDNEDVGSGEMSRVSNFHGGDSKAAAGTIFQKSDSKELTIDNYSGYTNILYEHDSSDPAKILGGDIKIGKAVKDSNIVLRTDYDANMSTSNIQNDVLNALANKLFYNAYIQGERNLSGKVEIAEGLTAQAAAKYYGDIAFDEVTGQGTSEGMKTPDQTVTDFETAITGGNDVAYVDGGVLDDGVYNFTRDTAITVNGNSVIASESKQNNVAIDLNNNKMDITGKNAGDIAGINAANGGKVEIDNAGIITVNVESSNGGQAVGLSVQNGGQLIIHNEGDNILTVRSTADENKKITAVKAEGSDSSIIIDGLVDVIGSGAGNSAVNAEADTSITIGGGTIKALNGAEYAIKADGVVNINSTAVNNKTVIEGDLTTGDQGRININLNTADSSWTGDYKQGTGSVNLKMSNNAVWTGGSSGTDFALEMSENAVWRVKDASNIKSLSAFNSDLDMTDGSGNVIVDNYSGSTTVIYKHDISTPTDIIGGDMTIKSAAADSVITLRTDSSGIDLYEEDVINDVLNALAQKLYYTGYVDNERNLAGYVQIAEGLTSASIAKQTGNIEFNESTGQGNLESGSVTPGVTYPETQTKDKFTTEIFGNWDVDKEYKKAGVLNKDTGIYVFTKDTAISTTLTEPTITGGRYYYGTITNYGNGDYNSDGISNTHIDMQGHNLDINTTVAMEKTSPMCYSAGIYAVKEGSIVIDNPGAINITNYSDYYYAAGIKAGSNASGELSQVIINNDNSEEHKVTIRGGMTSGSSFDINFWGIFTNNDNEVHIKGLADIETNNAVNLWAKSGLIDIGGGRFIANNYDAMQITNGGNININVQDKKGVVTDGDNKVVVKGDIATTTGFYGSGNGGTINVAFTTVDSEFDGSVKNPENANSTVNIWLKNGSFWNNSGESRVNSLYGGSSQSSNGFVFQNDGGSLAIDNYSGSTTVIYKHDISTPTDIIGGDMTIKSAAADSVITLRTDSSGIDLYEEDVINDVLNALAQKLYYTGYVDNERNLAGYVQIAEGLTSASIAKQTGNIEFNESTGQGNLESGSVTPGIIYPDEQIQDRFTTAVTGDDRTDKNYKKAGVLRDGVYGFTKDKTTITVSGNAAIYGADNDHNITADLNGNELVLNTVNTEIAAGISAVNGSKVEINNAGMITINAESSDSNAVGLMAENGGQLLIHNSGDKAVTIRTLGSDGGVTVKAEGAGSIVTVDGLVDVTASGSGNGAINAGAGAMISIGGGTVKALNDAEYAVKAEGNININNNKDKQTVIEGDILTGAAGKIEAVFSTSDSSWTGDYSGTGNMDLTLDNGAKWTGKNNGTALKLTMDNNSIWTGSSDGANFAINMAGNAVWNVTDNSGVKVLSAAKGIVDMSGCSGNLIVDSYAGDAMVIYKHDISTPTDIIGGDTTVKSAAGDSVITLRTDSSGIDMLDEDVITDVLDALAGKLYYTGYIEGERNLTGYVQIAEGLTASSAAKHTGNIEFSEENGQGSMETGSLTPDITYPGYQTEETFTTAITGDDKEYKKAGVLRDGIYSFTKDKTTISAEKNMIAGGPWLGQISSAISGSNAEHSVVIDLNNKAMEVDTITNTHTTGITAIGDGKVEINNAGAININAESTSGGQTAALFVNGGGQIVIHNGGTDLVNKVLTVRGDTTSKANGAVIKSMNGVSDKTSSIVIDGLVDVVADGDMTDGKGANEAISAVASTIEIGGGSIKAVNGAWAAIRAYGEFTSENAGIVNVNVKKDNDGNITGSGSNKTVIEGDIVTSGGMGTKGRVSIGLSTADSHWIGDYKDNTGYGVTPGQLGNVNLFMSNGADWTGYSTGSMNVQMTEAATWHGYNTSDNFVLGLENGSVWYNTNSTDKDSHIGYLTGSSAGKTNGVIDMTGSGSKLSIDNYSGSTTVIYKHDISAPTNIIGGDTTIKSAAGDSVITLSTDSSGIDMLDEYAIGDVLNALAQKLYYTGYVDNERNLTGYVQIAEGLTSASIAKHTGDIVFDESTGQGSLEEGSLAPDVEYPGNQTQEIFVTAITGDDRTDKEYRQAGVLNNELYSFTKDKTIINTGSGNTAITVSDEDQKITLDLNNNALDVNIANTGDIVGIDTKPGGTVEINNAGAIVIKAESTDGGKATGILAQDGGTVFIHNGGEKLDDKVLAVRGKTSAENSGAVVLAEGTGSRIIIDGLLDVAASGKGNIAVKTGTDAVITAAGGTLKAVSGAKTVIASDGIVNLNIVDKGQSKEAGRNKVILEGNVTAGINGEVNIGLGTKDSTWTGSYVDAENAVNTQASGGRMNLYMDNGAVWTGSSSGSEFNLSLRNGSEWNITDTSTVNKLAGGSEKAGIVDMTGSISDLTINEYSGSTVFIYKHDAVVPGNIIGGDTTINKAAEGSKVILTTDNTGIDMSNADTVETVLSGLANKLYYTDAENNAANLNGKVQIAEGLVASSAYMKVGEITFGDDKTGQGALKPGSVTTVTSDPEIIYGSKETAMMSGAKAAMASTAMIWRSENADLMQRMGDLRLQSGENGLWAKFYGGEYEMDAQNTNFSTSYKAYQLGYDKELDGGWNVGTAISYNDGSSTYSLGGHGDNSVISLSLYSTWQKTDGQYAGIILKGSSLKNDYTVYNDMGHKLDGDYKTWGASVSAEYGKRFEKQNGFYWDPSVQMTFGRVQGKDYNAHSDFLDAQGLNKDMYVSQDSFNSLIGRIGLGIGKNTESSNIFAKLSFVHEFAGDFTTNYAADGEPAGKTQIDFGGTWYELQLGGSTKLSDNSYLYATYERSFGGDITNKWRLDAGLRWSF